MDQHIMFDCPDILREFLFYLETIQGRSPKTVNGYYIELRTFLRYLKSVKVLKKLPQDAEELAQIKIDDVTKELVCSVTLSDIYDFLHFSLDVLGNSTASRSRKIAAIRALYKYLTTKTNYLEENPAKNLDTPAQRKSIPKYLTLEEALAVAAPQEEPVLRQVMELKAGEREILYLIYYEGFSTRETASLLGISQTAVTTRLQRARKKVRERLEEEGRP